MEKKLESLTQTYRVIDAIDVDMRITLFNAINESLEQVIQESTGATAAMQFQPDYTYLSFPESTSAMALPGVVVGMVAGIFPGTCRCPSLLTQPLVHLLLELVPRLVVLAGMVQHVVLCPTLIML